MNEWVHEYEEGGGEQRQIEIDRDRERQIEIDRFIMADDDLKHHH